MTTPVADTEPLSPELALRLSTARFGGSVAEYGRRQGAQVASRVNLAAGAVAASVWAYDITLVVLRLR